MKRIILLTVLLLAGSQLLLLAQKQFTLVENESKIIVEGTSSLHDWDMNLGKMSGNVDFEGKDASLEKFIDIYIEGKASTLTSHSSIMDKKAHDALLTNKFPNISFKMISVQNIKYDDEKFIADITGILYVAGKSRKVVIMATGTYLNGTLLTTEGSIELKMTDFGVNPPAAMLGTLKTGDEITVKFDLKFRV